MSERLAITPMRLIVLDSFEAIMECLNEGLKFTLLSVTDVTRYAGAQTATVETQGKNASRKVVLARREEVGTIEAPDRLLGLFG